MSQVAESAARTEPDRPLTNDELERASTVEVFDKDGTAMTFGALIKDKRVVVVFIRHFYCTSCQVYTHHLGKSILPGSLPNGTSVIVIGCGNHIPIPRYHEITKCPYPIYACPSLGLHKIFQFSRTLATAPQPQSSALPACSASAEQEEEQGYSVDAGGMARQFFVGVGRVLRHPSHAPESVHGPTVQNGGELIIEQDGTCSFIHRMHYSNNHTPLSKLAKTIGAEYVPLTDEQRHEL